MVRAERYFYDGVRRIQELWIDPIEAVPLVGTDDGEPLTMEQLGEGLRGSMVIGGTYLYRQYVWGPGHTDELLAEYDEDNTPWFTLQDAATDVVALCDASGDVATQYLYDPYGEPSRSSTWWTTRR